MHVAIIWVCMSADVPEEPIAPIFRAENQPSKKPSYQPTARWFLAWLIFRSEDGSNAFFRNVGSHTDYRALYPRRWQSIFIVHNSFCVIIKTDML
jgi:hypothetical protein